MKKTTKDDWLLKARQVHGWKYDYSKVNYVDYLETKVCIICPEHGEFWQTPRKHLLGGCKKCGTVLISKKRNEKAKKRFYNKISEIYDTTEANYTCAKDKVKLICHKTDNNGTEHGVFYITPNNCLYGYGCPKCGAENGILKKRRRNNRLYDYQNQINDVFGDNIYVVDKNYYNNNPYGVKIYCIKHKTNFITDSKLFPKYSIKYRCPICILNDENYPIISHDGTKISEIDIVEQPKLNEEVYQRIKNNEEVWVDVLGYEGKYKVSSFGKIKQINRVTKHGKQLSDRFCYQHIDTRNKRRVTVTLSGKQRSVHKIVFESFYNITIPKGYKFTIDHIDTNPLNNNLVNLRLCNGIRDNMLNNNLTRKHIAFSKNNLNSRTFLTEITNLENEIWTDCVGYAGLYQISNFGRVKALPRIIHEKNTGVTRHKKGHLMRLSLKDCMYNTVSLTNADGKKKHHYVHKLEYESFHGKILDGNEIDHIDSNPLNNKLENLKECTHIENVRNENSIKKRKINNIRKKIVSLN